MILNDALALTDVLWSGSISRSSLKALQDKRLKAILIKAYRHVPYYRDLMKSIHYNPTTDYAGIKDLQKIPVSSKIDIRTHGIEKFTMEGVDLRKYFHDATSGSSGVPLDIYKEEYARSLEIARWLRVLFANGYRVTDRIMALIAPQRLVEGKTLLQKLGLLRRYSIDFTLPSNIVLEKLIEIKPDIIYGNRSHIDGLAMQIIDQSVTLNWKLKNVFVVGEKVTPKHRELYRSAFGLEAIESYGAQEVGTIAYETPANDGLHIAEDLIYVEILDDDGNPVEHGIEGRVVITDLVTNLMPFIRYDLKDYAIVDPLSIADEYSRLKLKEIVGRYDDRIILPDGSTRTWHDFYLVFNKYPQVRQYRVEQMTKHRINIYVAQDDIAQEIRSSIEHEILAKYPLDVELFFEWVKAIPPDETGKLRIVKSHVAQLLA